MDQTNLADDIRQIAELLRGDFKQSEYGLVILPFTLLRTSAEHGCTSS